MSKLKADTLFDSLLRITDPRREHQKFHSLIDILVITICATICGAEHWTEIAQFGEVKEQWFAWFLQLENGIPSHDTFQRVFTILDPKQLQGVILEWINSAVILSQGSLVNIDGKNLRGSKNTGKGRKALNVVSAWAAQQSIVLGEVKCAEKSNEIRAIPELLQM